MALLGSALLVSGLGGAGLWAGEAIDLSTRQSTTPSAPSLVPATKDKISSLSRKSDGGSRVAIDPGSIVATPTEPRRSKKDEKKLQNDKLEKESWILTDRGELQEKETKANEFGVRDYGESIEKDKTAADIWFGPKQPNGSRESRPQPSGRAGSSAKATPAPPEDSSGEPLAKLSKETGKDGDLSLAAAAGKDLKLPSLLPGDPNDAPLKELFSGPKVTGSGGSSLDPRGARRDDVGLRSGPSLSDPSPAGLGKGMGLSRETGPQPAMGASPLLDISSRNGGLGSSLRGGDSLSGGGLGLGSGSRLGGASAFSSPFGSQGGLNNGSTPRNDGVPSLGRSAFESAPRSPLTAR